jgi:serine/threonine protein phosphatase PrpC
MFTQIYDSIQKELFTTKDINAHTSGSTLITVMLEQKGLLTCANVGDSRAILARQSTHFNM